MPINRILELDTYPEQQYAYRLLCDSHEPNVLIAFDVQQWQHVGMTRTVLEWLLSNLCFVVAFELVSRQADC
jgi:hypothetical protein